MRTMGTAALMAIGLTLAGAGSGQTLPDYQLHAGDKVIVGVYDDPKLLPQEITVAPDGKISYPAGRSARRGRQDGRADSHRDARPGSRNTFPIRSPR